MEERSREIAIEYLEHYKYLKYGLMPEWVWDMAIKALEQETYLDKIRAEISDFEEEVFNRPNTDYSDYAAVRHCLEIIDKYKAESEG